METRERILAISDELFQKYGIKSVTMDDIAKKLGMSKKTIYQFFEDKDELVLMMTSQILMSHQEVIDKIVLSSKDAVDEIMECLKYTVQIFQQMNPNLYYDMQKYHPLSWQKFKRFKEEVLIEKTMDNLNRGILDGSYRKDIDVKILAKMRVELIEISMNPEIYPAKQFDHTEVQLQFLKHYLYGLTTPMGQELIEQYSKEVTVIEEELVA